MFSSKLQTVRNISYLKIRNWYAGLVKPNHPTPPYKHIVQIGDPTLRVPCTEVLKEDIKSDKICKIIKQMKIVFNNYDCCGLAAPQIGIPLRIILIGFTNNDMKKYNKEEIKLKEMTLLKPSVLINPIIKIKDYTKISFPESCASVRGFWAEVPRYKAIEIEALGEDGETNKLNAIGWSARIIQHEMDHLDGKMYTDIMLRKSLTCGCWNEINARSGKIHIPYRPT